MKYDAASWFIPRKKAGLCSKVKLLLDIQYQAERDLLQQWITDFSSPDGETKAIDQFQATFHSVFFELYITQLLRTSGSRLRIDQIAPDFKVETDKGEYFIEATIANIADSGRTEGERTEQDVYGINDHYTILDESISRIRRRICTKSSDYKGYSDAIKSAPFVIAIADFSHVNYGQASYFPPLAVLYNAYYDLHEKTDLKILCEDSFGREYKYKETHGGKNQKGFSIGLFSSDKHKHISAVMYTCTLSLGKLSSLLVDHVPIKKYVCVEREDRRVLRQSGQSSDEFLADGIFIFHNPFAERPLDDDFLNMPGISHVRYFEKENIIQIRCNGQSPLMRRYVGPLIMAPFQLPEFEKFQNFLV
jgi:hypothetical protein